MKQCNENVANVSDDAEMSESESWRVYNKYKQNKKWANLESSTKILEEAGVDYTSHNMGIHLVVRFGTTIVDFWPSTGKWMPRKSGRTGRGVFNLLRYLGVVWSPEEDRFQAG